MMGERCVAHFPSLPITSLGAWGPEEPAGVLMELDNKVLGSFKLSNGVIKKFVPENSSFQNLVLDFAKYIFSLLQKSLYGSI